MQPENPRPGEPEDLVDSINASAGHVNALTITFLILCVYIGVAVASTTDEVLLLGRDLGLPLFDVEVPLVTFYILTPGLLFLLHLNLLLQEYLLLRKVLPPSAKAGDGLARRFVPNLLVNRMLGWRYPWQVQWLLRSTRWAINALIPLTLFLLIQVGFAPYHSRWTHWHQALVILDGLAILGFRQAMSRQRREHVPEQPGRPLLSWFFGTLLAVAVVAFSSGVAVQDGWLRGAWPLRWPELNLSLRGRTLQDPSMDGSGVRLAYRDLRNADFRGASLVKADFRGADLRGARFVSADLGGARFEPAGESDGRFRLGAGEQKHRLLAEARSHEEGYQVTRLEGADLRNANLDKANLILAKMARARLENARLAGAELSFADLTAAQMRDSDLRDVDLAHARLLDADLTRADLQKANLSFAVLAAARLTGARLMEANLANAELGGADLVGADLRAAQLQGAHTAGVDFIGADLRGATRGLLLYAADLRQARLDVICRERDTPLPYLVDFRGVEFQQPLAECPTGPNRDIRPILGAELLHRGLLYGDEQRVGPLADWPPVSEQGYEPGAGWGEGAFYRERADLLVQAACRDEGFARRLLQRAVRPQLPGSSTFEAVLRRSIRRRLGQGDPSCVALREAFLTLSDDARRKLSREVAPDLLLWSEP